MCHEDKIEKGIYFVQWGSKPWWCSTYIIEITDVDGDNLWYKILENLKESKNPWPTGKLQTSRQAFRYRSLNIIKVTSEKHLKRLKMEYKLTNGVIDANNIYEDQEDDE